LRPVRNKTGNGRLNKSRPRYTTGRLLLLWRADWTCLDWSRQKFFTLHQGQRVHEELSPENMTLGRWRCRSVLSNHGLTLHIQNRTASVLIDSRSEVPFINDNTARYAASVLSSGNERTPCIQQKRRFRKPSLFPWSEDWQGNLQIKFPNYADILRTQCLPAWSNKTVVLLRVEELRLSLVSRKWLEEHLKKCYFCQLWCFDHVIDRHGIKPSPEITAVTKWLYLTIVRKVRSFMVF